ncbi:MAG: MerR family transcriptional regulator [Deltaproteobacteria bacterium]|nr:MerR family transcriptional regulator [Deltaproteobacteria bacterium]
MVEIPQKRYFKIGEVSQLTGVEAYVIRYWESEFSQLAPTRVGSSQRLYTRQDVELLLTIRRLLYEEKYTIAGARRKLEAGGETEAVAPAEPKAQPRTRMAEVRAELKAILDILS